MATQLKTEVLPITQSIRRSKARKITEADTKFSAYSTLRMVRADAKRWGVREKKAKEKAEAEKNK